MFVYQITCGVDRDDARIKELSRVLAEAFDSKRVMNTTWFVATDADIEDVELTVTDVFGDTDPLIIVDITGDFTMQGLPEELMQWVDERFAGEGEA